MKRNHNSGAKSVTCSKCNKEAHGIPGKTHRMCSGHQDQPNRKAGNQIPAPERGKWA